MRFLAAAAALAIACGCGYVGDPLPPALNIPERPANLQVRQVADRLVLEYTAPVRTTEALPLRGDVGAEVQIGDRQYPAEPSRASIPVDAWVGQTVPVRVRALAGGKASEWSDAVTFRIVEPLPEPRKLAAESHPQGVRLTWQSPARAGIAWRVLRGDAEVGRPTAPEFVDTAAEFGNPYQYSVQAVLESAVSEVAGPVAITPADTFPPPEPAGLTAVAAVNSIELAWERSPAPDFARYRIYRDGQPLGETDAPSWSDKQAEAGKTHRYEITAVDARGNESARSAAVQVALP